MRRDLVVTVVELGSVAAVVVGVGQVSSAAGWVTAGVFGLVASWRASR